VHVSQELLQKEKKISYHFWYGNRRRQQLQRTQ